MSNTYFQFKHFLINQDQCAMKVGTDGVLLGAWADVTNINETLDIGTGTGLLALMIAQRSESNITAIEINEKASKQALENVNLSAWRNRINVENISIQDFCDGTNKKFDLIICNPPFFEKSGMVSESDRVIARQAVALSFEELIFCVHKLMKQDGRFCTIIPHDEESHFLKIAERYELICNKKTIVFPAINKKPKRVLLEFSKTYSKLISSELIIETTRRHEYTSEYMEMTKDFYLKF